MKHAATQGERSSRATIPKPSSHLRSARRTIARPSPIDQATIDQATIEPSIKTRGECLTALPVTIDVAALAQLYNSPPVSHIAREDLLQEARMALTKYELAESDLELAADSLARAMHMLLEQHGLDKLEPEHMAELERHVLNWHGLCQPETVADRYSSHNARHAETPTTQHSIPNAHGTAHSR